MHIDVLFTSREVGYMSLEGRTAVVIDVLRATTTIAAALSHGAVAVYPVGEVDDARALASRAQDAVLGGERGGLPLDGFHAGNSPLEYTEELVKGRPVVLTTTNGTLALERTRNARAAWIATGALVNAESVARWALRQGTDVALVCSGTEERFTLEDVGGAGCIVAHCQRLGFDGVLTDAALAARHLWERYRHDPQRLFDDSFHGRRLRGLGFDADLAYCATVSALDVTPVWVEDRLVREG